MLNSVTMASSTAECNRANHTASPTKCLYTCRLLFYTYVYMATYKVIQDIEAEDKLVGPFGIRQFIYLLVVAALLFVAFRLAQVAWFLALPFLPPIAFFCLLALPISQGQPTEVWLLAKLRFFLKPRTRLWSQSGARELVTITAPKATNEHLTKEISQSEVKSRLQTLATTLDTHGWAAKHLSADPFASAATAAAGTGGTDRLVNVSPEAQSASPYDAGAENDILDEQNNPTAQKLGQMIDASNKSRRQQIVSKMKQPEPQQTPQSVTPPPPTPSGAVVTPKTDPANQPQQPTQQQDDQSLTPQQLLDKIHADQAKPKNYGHMRVIKTLEQQEAEKRAQTAREAAKKAMPPAVTQPTDPDIINLARNDDLNVETVARQMSKKTAKKAKDEIVINLHDD